LANSVLRQLRIVLQSHRITHSTLADTLLDRHQQIFVVPAQHPKFGVPSHSDGVTRSDLEAVIKAWHIPAENIFQQHKRMLTLARRQRHEARDDVRWDMKN
jgi:hypothetical protein